MKYYFLETRSEPGDPFAEKIAIPASFQHFYLGQKVSVPAKPLWITISELKHGLPDLIQGPYTYIIGSERLRRVFEELEPNNVQFIPVHVYVRSKKVAEYHFVQVLNNVDVIDWSRSDLESYPEDKYSITKVRKMVLDPNAISGRHVFRLMGLSVDLVVSELFRRRVVEQKMTGMHFTPIEEFRLD